MSEFSAKKIVFAVVSIAIPSLCVHFDMGEALQASGRASEYIGLIFSILSASLFAVISILGSPSMLLETNWRKSYLKAQTIQLRLMRLAYLFVVYLIVLALLVVCEIIKSKELVDWYRIYDVLAFASVFAFIISLWLPFEIKAIQVERLEEEIRLRRDGSK